MGRSVPQMGLTRLAVACLLASERDVDVVGVDLGDAQVARASARSLDAGLDRRVRFEVGDAECLIAEDATFDAVVCECAFCTFPDKRTAAAELARVLRQGRRLGITDVWLDPERLDPELRTLAGRVACFADARPIDEVRTILEQAGLKVTNVERHDDALAVQRFERLVRCEQVIREFNQARHVVLDQASIRSAVRRCYLVVDGRAMWSRSGRDRSPGRPLRSPRGRRP